MTSSLGINDSQPRNLEAPRSTDLLPDQIRVTANDFMVLLTEYYKFMNINSWATTPVTNTTYSVDMTTGLATSSTSTVATSTVLSGKSGSGPSNVIYSILAELDIDQVDADYLSHIQRAIASYVPIPVYMSTSSSTSINTAPFYKYLTSDQISSLRALLYQRIVKYFYNTRGSQNSLTSFFKIFYNDTASMFDVNDYGADTMTTYIQPWLTSSGMSLASTNVVTKLSISSQTYYKTPIQAWAPFSYVISTAQAQADFDLAYRALVHPVGFKYYINGSNTTGGAFDINDSRMVNARRDYQATLWFLDPTAISEYASYIISNADAAYVPENQNTATYTYADWSNIGTIDTFKISISSSFIQNTNTISISTLSSLNITPSMFVTSTNSSTYFTITGTSSTTSAISIYSVSTSTGIITLNGSLSSATIAANTILTFAP